MLSAFYCHCYFSHSHKNTKKHTQTPLLSKYYVRTQYKQFCNTVSDLGPVDHKSISGTAPQGRVLIFQYQSSGQGCKCSTLNIWKYAAEFSWVVCWLTVFNFMLLGSNILLLCFGGACFWMRSVRTKDTTMVRHSQVKTNRNVYYLAS